MDSLLQIRRENRRAVVLKKIEIKNSQHSTVGQSDSTREKHRQRAGGQVSQSSVASLALRFEQSGAKERNHSGETDAFFLRCWV